jgi:hypothetical protein
VTTFEAKERGAGAKSRYFQAVGVVVGGVCTEDRKIARSNCPEADSSEKFLGRYGSQGAKSSDIDEVHNEVMFLGRFVFFVL